MPLISTIKEENEHLKHEKSQFEGEMALLHKLSQMILTENQQLRRHYCARTSDIKKLVETISINSNEEANDVTHQSFLLRESNTTLVKQIEIQMKDLALTQQGNQAKHQDFDGMSRRNVQVEQVSRDLQVKNKQLFDKCEQLKIETSSDSSRKDEEINDLLSEVTSLMNTNKGNIRRARVLNN